MNDKNRFVWDDDDFEIVTKKYDDAERAVLETMAKQRGLDWVRGHEQLILDEARSLGQLPQKT